MVKKICCIGAGYVGGPTMAVIAHECPEVTVNVLDSNKEKIKAWNCKDLSKLPVYEPGLAKIIEITRNRNLFFSDNFDKIISESEIIFLAVNTPTKKTGPGKGYAADLSNVEMCAKTIAHSSKSNKIIVEKSTLPVKTAEKIKEILSKNNINKVHFEVLSNPEFLAEGTAIENLYKSDRVLIGGDSSQTAQKAIKSLTDIYKKWIPEEKILITNIWSSELSKLASNAMLAQRISSINSLSALCEKTGASINELSKAIGSDARIGPKFLEASVGFGGSCFKKDILNLVYLAKTYNLEEVAEYWEQVVKINEYQKNRFTSKILEFFKHNVKGIKISVLGWAFKKNTNDSRESASIFVAVNLLENGAKLQIYDPMVKQNKIIFDICLLLEDKGFNKIQVSKILENITVFNNLEKSIQKTEAIVITTEWAEFKDNKFILKVIKSSNPQHIFDGRNISNIQNKRDNSGRITIQYKNLEQFESISNLLKKN